MQLQMRVILRHDELRPLLRRARMRRRMRRCRRRRRHRRALNCAALTHTRRARQRRARQRGLDSRRGGRCRGFHGAGRHERDAQRRGQLRVALDPVHDGSEDQELAFGVYAVEAGPRLCDARDSFALSLRAALRVAFLESWVEDFAVGSAAEERFFGD